MPCVHILDTSRLKCICGSFHSNHRVVQGMQPPYKHTVRCVLKFPGRISITRAQYYTHAVSCGLGVNHVLFLWSRKNGHVREGGKKTWAVVGGRHGGRSSSRWRRDALAPECPPTRERGNTFITLRYISVDWPRDLS